MNAQTAKVPETSGVIEAVQQLNPTERQQMEHLMDRLKALGAELSIPAPAPDAANATAAPAAPVLPAGNAATTRETAMTTITAPAAPSATTLAHNTSNQLTLDQVLEIAKTAGADTARGSDSLTKLLLKVAEGAFVGTLDATKDKHGPGITDAAKINEAFSKAKSTTNIFDAKADKARKQTSIIHTMIKLGGYTKGGNGEPLSTLNNLMTLRDQLRRDSANAKRVEDPVNCMIRFARAQLKLDTMIPQGDLKTYALKVDNSHSKAVEDWWDGVRRQAQKLKIGKLANCPDSDTSAEIDALIKTANKRLKTIADAKGVQPADAGTAARQARNAGVSAPQATQTANAA